MEKPLPELRVLVETGVTSLERVVMQPRAMAELVELLRLLEQLVDQRVRLEVQAEQEELQRLLVVLAGLLLVWPVLQVLVVQWPLLPERVVLKLVWRVLVVLVELLLQLPALVELLLQELVELVERMRALVVLVVLLVMLLVRAELGEQ